MIQFRNLRLSGLAYFLIIAALLAAVVFLSWRLLSGNPVAFSQKTEQEIQPPEETSDVHPAYQSMLAVGFPAVAAADEGVEGIFSFLWSIVVRGDIHDPRFIMQYPMPYLDHAPNLPDNDMDHAMEVASNQPGRSGIDRSDVSMDISQADSDEDNMQEVSDEIKIQIKQIQVDDDPIEMTGDGPKILIYHSHSRESYRQDPNDPYKEASAEAFRTDDLNHSIIKVGTALAKELTKRGIAVLHDKTNHEKGNYNASYSKSLKTLQKRMAEHDSLNMFIDVHRNAYGRKSSKKPDDDVVIINGERVAKLLIVIGTGEGVMGGFSDKPNWKENAKLAIKLTNKINELYPGLAKDVYYKTGRYNQHVSTNAILIEVGSTLTTLEEAERATVYLAEAISQIIE
ncbi:MAG: stage II sporulation protein P [Caldicoprobacterales bacterium]|jgi:stage II sporulation protein P|nr:stage II sporulation protein P [Clostridiales bacterium]